MKRVRDEEKEDLQPMWLPLELLEAEIMRALGASGRTFTLVTMAQTCRQLARSPWQQYVHTLCGTPTDAQFLQFSPRLRELIYSVPSGEPRDLLSTDVFVNACPQLTRLTLRPSAGHGRDSDTINLVALPPALSDLEVHIALFQDLAILQHAPASLCFVRLVNHDELWDSRRMSYAIWALNRLRIERPNFRWTLSLC